MEVKNSLVKKPTDFKGFINHESIQRQIADILGERRLQNFITGIVTAVTNNPDLKDCNNSSILSGALLGEALNLSPSTEMGQYYLVPFKDKERGLLAQFQLGYKGYIQLAMRSNLYKKLNVVAVKDGELDYFDYFNEEIIVNPIQDDVERENAKTTGYYAMFELHTGFRKAIYWSKERMEKHAIKYSKAYRAKKGYSFWEKDFDQMAFKTMIRQLISKWGIMSTELEKAIVSDMAYIKDDMTPEYIDNIEVEEVETKTIKQDDLEEEFFKE